MRKGILLACSVACALAVNGQDFPGIRSSNYSGVNSVFYNPANLADNRFKASFNLLSINASVGNDHMSYKLNAISKTLDGDKLKGQFLGGSAARTNGLLAMAINGPGLSVSPGNKLGFSLTSRARVFGTITNFEGKLFGDDADEIDPDLPHTFNQGADMKVSAHIFSEFAFSGAYSVLNRDQHFLKAGASFKYLVGVGSAFYNFNQFSGTIDEQPDGKGSYLTNAKGRIAVGMGGLNLDAADYGDLISKESRGFGADLGFVYEYRPDYADYRNADGKEDGAANKYKLKLAVSLHDIGKIRYQKDPEQSADYNMKVPANQKLYLDEIGNEDEDQTINDYFASRPDVFTPSPGNGDINYKVNLPTTLNIDVDYQLHNRVYLNFFTQLPVSGKSSDPYNAKLYTIISLTPRFETKAFGFYLPIQYNGLTKLNAGVSLRLGPLFVGSGSVLTALVGNSKQADVHVGLRFGSLKRLTK